MMIILKSRLANAFRNRSKMGLLAVFLLAQMKIVKSKITPKTALNVRSLNVKNVENDVEENVENESENDVEALMKPIPIPVKMAI